MKHTKDRVIAIDYFRGILILMVIVNHAALFSKPYAYLTGDGGLWTSAAELFLMLSGLTFAIVRGPQILTNFGLVLKKTLRRAAIIYLINITIVFTALLLALILVAQGLPNDVSGALPTKGGLSLVLSILTYSYSIGWASFLMYFSVFLVFAPFAMYLLRTRYWMILPFLSVSLFLVTRARAPSSVYESFGLWQIYFVMGMIIGRFRHPAADFMHKLKPALLGNAKLVVISVAAAMISASVLLDLPIYPYVARLANDGWLPVKLQAAYIHLLNHKPTLDNLFMDTRTGLLRPVVALMVFISAYLIYQRYQDYLLKKVGVFVLSMGRNTLAVFAAQALAIPLLVAINLPNNLASSTLLTGFLILSMWLVAQANINRTSFKFYIADLRASFYNAKYAYSNRYEDS